MRIPIVVKSHYSQSRKELYLPLKPPFIFMNQFACDVVAGMDWTVAYAIANDKGQVSNEFDLMIGQTVFQRGQDGKVEIAGLYWDTSG